MRQVHFLILTVSVSLLAGCSDNGTGTGTDATVQFNVATSSSAAAANVAALSGTPDTLIDGTNTLVIDTAQMVLRDIKFHLTETATCSDSSANGNPGDDDHGGNRGDSTSDDHIRMSQDDDGEDDDCDELRIGPYLLDLPLDAGPARSFTVDIPAGTYREVKFKVHKANRAEDAAFVATHPEFDERSVRVVGTWNGAPFVFTSDVTANQESEFDPPLTVDGSVSTELTLFVDLSNWFRVDGALVDPAQANDQQPLSSQVKNNIKASIRAFEDDDHDGEDDHGSHGGDDLRNH
jgi:hypothetical protein